MPSQHWRSSTVFFGVLVALDLVALGVLALVVSGALVRAPAESAASAPDATTAAPTATTVERTTDAGTTVATHGTAGVKTSVTAPADLHLVVRATRGDCWVSARADGTTGKVLYAQVLASGDQMTVSARRIWLELGAGANVDVLVNGKRRVVNNGTSALLLS